MTAIKMLIIDFFNVTFLTNCVFMCSPRQAPPTRGDARSPRRTDADAAAAATPLFLGGEPGGAQPRHHRRAAAGRGGRLEEREAAGRRGGGGGSGPAGASVRRDDRQ